MNRKVQGHRKKNPQAARAVAVEAKARRQSLIFLLLNFSLFVFKILAALLTSSLSLFADAINNLNDSLSSVISFISLKIYNKPADHEHPYGHQRVDYIAGAGLAIIILITAYELLRSAITRLLNPEPLTLSAWPLALIGLSILIKIYFYFSSKRLARELDSLIFKAVATDSRSDILISALILLTLVITPYSTLPLDAGCGLILALIIGWQAIELLRQTFDELLGKRAPKELIDGIKNIVQDSPLVISYHDLIIHSYGRSNVFASIHILVDSKLNLIELHQEVDRLERLVYQNYAVSLVIHVDPLCLEDEELQELSQLCEKLIQNINPSFYPHDFQILRAEDSELKTFYFELKLPDDYDADFVKLREEIILALIKAGVKGYAVEITIDRAYIADKQNYALTLPK
ncbi:MAG: cation diffusion facilitator family transporter [Eubacteriales bacterium]|nr:cation diffusion facilitator family transporter [Eubacteriales bacterium]